MDQKLLENLKVFLKQDKGCSNVATCVPIGNYLHGHVRLLPGTNPASDYGKIDVLGGLFIRGEKRPEIELHGVEDGSGLLNYENFVGRLFWHKFGMSQNQYTCILADRLYLYLMLDREMYQQEIAEFCKAFGFGILEVDDNQNINQLANPENQHEFLKRNSFECRVSAQLDTIEA